MYVARWDELASATQQSGSLPRLYPGHDCLYRTQAHAGIHIIACIADVKWLGGPLSAGAVILDHHARSPLASTNRYCFLPHRSITVFTRPALIIEMFMGIGTIGIPWWVPWDSHGNESDNDYIMGMEVGIKVWE